MSTMRGARVPVGSASWIAEERTTALSIVQAEAEEFSFAARNELDWLNEHMAGIFNENEVNVAEIFKTPGKLRGKTPRTARKVDNGEPRVPLSDVFSATPNGAPNAFTQQLTRTSTTKLDLTYATSPPLVNRTFSPHKPPGSPRPAISKQPVVLADSGYYGSQDMDNVDDMDVDLVEDETEIGEPRSSPPKPSGRIGHVAFDADEKTAPASPTLTRTMRSPEVTFQTAKEDQTTRMMRDITEEASLQLSETPISRSPAKQAETPSSPVESSKFHSAQVASPNKTSPVKTSPAKRSPVKQASPSPSLEAANSPSPEPTPAAEAQEEVDAHLEGTPSPSDVDSSPIRPVRKSSLNFASLPAREPLNHKSLGPRVSRTSHLDNNRTSYYGRHTGGKSLGNVDVPGSSDDEEDNDDMDIDAVGHATKAAEDSYASNHNKAYTQRLQDQINMLGKSQPNTTRTSKSIQSSAVVQQLAHAAVSQPASESKSASPKKPAAPPTPGAFPQDDEDEDEEDDWIAPPVPAKDSPIASPSRPVLPKSHTADVMEGIDGAETVSGPEFALPKQRQTAGQRGSPKRGPIVPERTTSTYGHAKSASVSALPDFSKEKMVEDLGSSKKHISVSNPLDVVPEDGRPESPKSPSRSFRDSPLKQVKNKLSSILKTSKGLLASSAAISAEGKALMSPSTTRLGFHAEPSTDSIVTQSVASEPLYPDLSKRLAANAHGASRPGSPERPVARRTRASVEKEKEDKRKEKEARLMADQMSKLDRARADEREKARVFSEEQEKIIAMEKQVAAQKEKEREAEKEKDRQREKAVRTPAPKEALKPTRTSPRKVKGQAEAEVSAAPSQPEKEKADVEMIEAPAPVPPPSASRPAGPQTARNRELRRPKPTKEAASRAKQQPTVIRVNTGSQHSQYHPSNSQLSSGLEGTLGSSVKPKSQPSSHSKQASVNSFKSSAGSTGRPKALELAAKRKEQEERDLQKRKDAKAELERKRAAIQEEERKQELQRRQDAEKQREQAEARKRQAIERAKQTRAPPPAVRTQPNGPVDYSASQRSDGQPSRPPSRLNSIAPRSQEDRPVNAILSNASKAGSKRPLPQDDDSNARKPVARNGPAYQAKEAKRRRTSDDFADELDMDIQPPNIKGPPVRPPSVGFKKEMPTKPMYSNGYSNVPQSASRDLFKGVVTAQHNSTVKTAKQLDINQFAKGEIPFNLNPNPAGPAHKTPARPMATTSKTTTIKKSATRSSPRFQDGDKIDLPEIDTDPEDEDEDHGEFRAAWTDSPDLRRALARQENQDPEKIFGPPQALNMEEVFHNSKDRWHKFRARTSSANWSGTDRLTEDEIRKDLAARDRLRREGGWSYEMSKDLA